MSRFIAVRSKRLSLCQSAVNQTVDRSPNIPDPQKQLMRRAVDLHAQADANGMPIAAPTPTADAPATLEHHIYLSKAHFELAEARRTGDAARAATAAIFWRDYSSSDPGWLECLAVYAAYYGDGAAPQYIDWSQQNPPDINFGVIQSTLANNAKVLLIGDWGTGMTDAVSMIQAAFAMDPDISLIIHLGDIYYSGTPSECTAHVQQALTTLGYNVPLLTIPGNHEYYSGGAGYYNLINGLNSKWFGQTGWDQSASYFCLRTEDGAWQFLGMDTGYNDHDPAVDGLGAKDPFLTGPALQPTEVEWHVDKITNFSGNTILLSHHQLYSAKATLNGWATPCPPYMNSSLFNAFLPYFGKISAWFWGHEHNFAMYQNGLFGMNMGRLVGCSGYEEMESEAPYTVNYPAVPYAPNISTWELPQSPYQTNNTAFVDHGCAIIDFTRAATSDPINITYYAFPSWDQDTTPPNPLPALISLATETIAAPSVLPTYVWSGNQSISTPNGTPESNFAPSLAYYGGLLYAAFKGAHSNNLYLAWWDGNGWQGNETLNSLTGQTYSSNVGPALAVFNGLMYLIYKDDSSNNLYISWYNGTMWQGNVLLSTMPGSLNPQTASAPALCVYNSLLYLVYTDPSGVLYSMTFDGTTWANQAPISVNGVQAQSATTPTAVVYPGATGDSPQIYVTYLSAAGDNTLLLSTFNGTTWSGNAAIVTTDNGQPLSNAGPWMAPIGKQIVMLYKGLSSSIYSATYDGANWTGNLPLGQTSPISPDTGYQGSIVPYLDGLYTLFLGEYTDDLTYAQMLVVGSSASQPAVARSHKVPAGG